MKRKNLFSIKLLGTAIILSVALFSCNNNDTNDSSTTATKDTTATMPSPDTASMKKEAMMDTSAPATGMAKPNPAKKGMKGKATITESMNKSTDKMEADNTGVYGNVEVLPSFPGGYKGLQKFFDDNLQYPEAASNDGVEATVNVSFVVDETGKLTNAKVDGDKNGYGIDEEALRVVNKMPTWNPGKLKGKNVKTKFTLPVRFVLY